MGGVVRRCRRLRMRCGDVDATSQGVGVRVRGGCGCVPCSSPALCSTPASHAVQWPHHRPPPLLSAAQRSRPAVREGCASSPRRPLHEEGRVGAAEGAGAGGGGGGAPTRRHAVGEGWRRGWRSAAELRGVNCWCAVSDHARVRHPSRAAPLRALQAPSVHCGSVTHDPTAGSGAVGEGTGHRRQPSCAFGRRRGALRSLAAEAHS